MGTCVPSPAAAKSAMDIVFLTIAASYPGNQTRRGTYSADACCLSNAGKLDTKNEKTDKNQTSILNNGVLLLQ